METGQRFNIYIHYIQSFVYSVVVDVPEDHLFSFLFFCMEFPCKSNIYYKKNHGHLKWLLQVFQVSICVKIIQIPE